MATVRIMQRSKKAYTIIIDYGIDPVTKKRKTENRLVHTDDPAVAEAERLEIMKQLTLGQYKTTPKITLGEYCKVWFNTPQAKDLERKTIERYQLCANLRIIPWIGHIRICDLKRSDLMSFYNKIIEVGHMPRRDKDGNIIISKDKDGKPLKQEKKEVSKTTVMHHHRFIRRLLNHAIYEDGLLTTNVALRMDIPEPESEFDEDDGEVKVFTADEIIKIEEAAEPTGYKPLLAVAVRTGLRREELLALTWDCIDYKKRSMVVKRALIYTKEGKYELKTTKNSQRRTIEISPQVIAILKEVEIKQAKDKARLDDKGINEDGSRFDLYQHKNLVFCREDGFYHHPDTCSKWFPAFCEKIGVTRLGIHSLRHTHASHLLAAGEDISYVSKRLGHSGIEITFKTYLHLIPNERREALVELEKRFKKKPKQNNKSIAKPDEK